MKKNRIIIIFLLLLGVLSSVALYFTFSANLTDVVVATQTVRANSEITPDMIATRKMDRDYLPKNYIEGQFAEQVVGRYTDIGFTEGSVLTTDNVATGDGNRTAVIPEGYTIMNVSLDTLPQGIQTGDYVNIVIGSNSNDKGKVVLTYQKIAVTNIVKDSDKRVTGIEVQVTPHQAQKIEYAQLNGSISVSLLPKDYRAQSLEIVDESEFMKTGN